VWLGLAEPEPVRGSGWGAGYVPNVPVVTQDGDRLRFYDDLIKDKLVVISFIYTSCKDVCPLTTARMAQVQDRLGDAVGRDIFFLSISIDPETDTPEVLKAYSKAFDVGPGWQFVTGGKDDIEMIRHRLGDRLEDLNDHTQEVRIGNGATGEWRRAALLGDIEVLLEAIRQMDRAYRSQRRVAAADATAETRFRLKEEPGQAVFRRLCAPCHTVGVGDRVGPDLYGVTERRDRDWLVRFLRFPEKMRAEGDPIALAVSAEYPVVDMPSLGLGEIDAEDMIAYLEEETARLAKMEAEHQANHDHSSHKHGSDDQAGHDHSGHDSGGDDHGSHDHSGHDHGAGDGHQHQH
jgi:protein SCO1/2